MKPTPKMILAKILACGTNDITFLCDLFDRFEVDYDDVTFCETNLNGVIGEIFTTVIARYPKAYELFKKNDERVNFFTNCSDSHLYINAQACYNDDDVAGAVNSL